MNISFSGAPAEQRQSPALRIVMTAVFAALTLLATFVFKIQTPAFGYIHIGECFVILSGIMLGPLYGGLAAGIGSGLADLLGGYAIWAPGTFFIKLASAAAAGLLFRTLSGHAKRSGNAAFQTESPENDTFNGESEKPSRKTKKAGHFFPAVIIGGVSGEAVMILGYFLYNILVICLANGSFTHAGFASAVSLSVLDIPFNLIQAAVGIVLAVLLAPLFKKLSGRG